MGALQRAPELEGGTVGASHLAAVSTLVQMGRCHYEMREYDATAAEVRWVVEILRNAQGNEHSRVGRVTLLLASVFKRHVASMSSAAGGESARGDGRGAAGVAGGRRRSVVIVLGGLSLL